MNGIIEEEEMEEEGSDIEEEEVEQEWKEQPFLPIKIIEEESLNNLWTYYIIRKKNWHNSINLTWNFVMMNIDFTNFL